MNFFSSWGPTVLIFIGVIFTAIGGVWSQINQSKHDSKVIELQDKTINNITGGDSFCSIALVKGLNSFIIQNHGKYPVYDLNVQVVDLQKFDPQKPSFPTSIISEATEFPDTASTVDYPFLYANKDEANYNFFMFARNGGITQNLHLKKVKGEWESHTVIKRNKGVTSHIIYEEKTPDYPSENK